MAKIVIKTLDITTFNNKFNVFDIISNVIDMAPNLLCPEATEYLDRLYAENTKQAVVSFPLSNAIYGIITKLYDTIFFKRKYLSEVS